MTATPSSTLPASDLPSAPLRPATRLGLLALAVLGLVAAASSTYVHYQLLRDPSYTSFCDLSATVSCTQLYQSQYGSLFGAPVALLGLLWFALVLVMVAGARQASPGYAANLSAYLFALSTIGLAVVLYLAYASWFVLQSVCLLCVATYAAVVGIFVISGAATTFPMTTLPRRALSDVRALIGNPVALVIALMFLGGSALGVAFFPRDEGAAVPRAQAAGQDKTAEFEKWYTSQPRREVPVAADGAAVVIVKFNDYQCPPCKQTYMDYKGILAEYQKKYPGKFKFVTKDYPLDPECNASAPRGTHVAACEAAVAVRLARRNNRDHALEDWLFSNQSALTPDVVKTAAKEVGGVNDFDAQYQGQLQAVKADIALGGLLGVEATPTFYINGVLVRGGLAPQYLQAALDYELRPRK